MKALVSMMCQINPSGFRRKHGLAKVSLSTVDEVTASSGWTDRAPSGQLMWEGRTWTQKGSSCPKTVQLKDRQEIDRRQGSRISYYFEGTLLVVKKSTLQCRGHGFDPRLGNWDPTCWETAKPKCNIYIAHLYCDKRKVLCAATKTQGS